MEESSKDVGDRQPALGIDYKGVNERLEKVSDRISAQVRTLGLGILAFSWGLLVGQSTVANEVAQVLRWHLLVIGALTILSLLLDFLQYVSGYVAANTVRRTMERQQVAWGQFSYTSVPYRVQIFCFVAKQIVLIATATWLVIAIVLYVIIKVFR